MNRPQKFWQEFRDNIYAKDAALPKAQEREISLAFYAGMAAAFNEANEISVRHEELGAARIMEMELFRREINSEAMRATYSTQQGNVIKEGGG
jgi:hypothetical protein